MLYIGRNCVKHIIATLASKFYLGNMELNSLYKYWWFLEFIYLFEICRHRTGNCYFMGTIKCLGSSLGIRAAHGKKDFSHWLLVVYFKGVMNWLFKCYYIVVWGLLMTFAWCLHSKTSKWIINRLFCTLVLSLAEKLSVFMGVSHWRLGINHPLLWVDNSFAY